MKKFSMFCAVLLAISGCGGGSDAVDTNPAPTQAIVQPPPVLAPYVGTWIGDCSRYKQETMVISISPAGVLAASSTYKVFAGADCSGSVVANESMSESYSLSYVKSIDAMLSPSSGEPALSVKGDRVNMTLPSFTYSVIGEAVTYEEIGGVPEVCVNLGIGGGKSCMHAGTNPAFSEVDTLFVQGNDLYFLSQADSVDTNQYHLSRKL